MTVLEETTAPAVVAQPAHPLRGAGFGLGRFGRGISDAHLLAGWRGLITFAAVGFVLLASAPGENVFLAAIALSSVWFFALMSTYSGPWVSPLVLGTATTSAAATVTGLVPASLVGFWVPGVDLSPIQLGLAAVAVFLTSVAFEKVGAPSLARRTRVLVVGSENGGSELADELRSRTDLPFECVGSVAQSDSPDALNDKGTLSIHDFASVARDDMVDVVVLAGEGRADAVHRLLEAGVVDVRVVGPAEFYEHAFGYVPIRHLSPMWFMSVLHLYQRRHRRVAKRVADIAVAALAIIATAPALLAIAFFVRCSSQGPILYRQIRCGEGGKPFEMLKFRTMPTDAEAMHGAVWAGRNDPRVTRVGRFLRRARLDELPQLWNVLRGEMSVVGPRPERPELVPMIQEQLPFFTRRHLMKPGITGWAQIRHGYTDDVGGAAEKLGYDLYYLRHRSLALDLAITIKTVQTVLGGSGAR